jgi:hypothetical protein
MGIDFLQANGGLPTSTADIQYISFVHFGKNICQVSLLKEIEL